MSKNGKENLKTGSKKNNKLSSGNAKKHDLEINTTSGAGKQLTTNQGVKINDNQNSLKAGNRGSTLMEDFILREKITHFDHERIPERVVHARGSAAHGYFQVYESMRKYTKAAFLQDPDEKTPVFVRFSTVAGSRGSTDLARDVRGFAVKFYTQEGIFDLVGNNMPVFFIQDAIKFPDLIHAVKPEPDNEMPQAASAHDTFWDFISLMPESMHMIMWLMSDRAIPRSYRMMEGFGVHTFRFVNEKNKSVFVKFHWKPLLGMHSVVWDEAQMISGKDPDFHRRDLWESIENGSFPEWELGVQIVNEEDEFSFDFDLLDPTKLIPEELVPVKRIGKLVLDRNPSNFFAETEQVAYHVGNIVPGIDFTNDPLMQGRLFSYTDTQLIRLGGPNFHEIPINRSIKPVFNNQRDGFMRQTIVADKTSYEPNSLGGGCPFQAKMSDGGFTSFAEKIDAVKVRERSGSFFDHFSQAKLFFNSQSDVEKKHLTKALRFELGKVKVEEIRKRMVGLLTFVDAKLAKDVADGLGIPVPVPEQPVNHSFPADANPKDFQPVSVKQKLTKSAALSMANTVRKPDTRKIAVLADDGFDDKALTALVKAAKSSGAMPMIIASHLGSVIGSGGKQVPVDESFLTTSSALFDAVYVVGGRKNIDSQMKIPEAMDFINQAYKHYKPLGISNEAVELLRSSDAYKKCQGGSEKGPDPKNENSADGNNSNGKAGKDKAVKKKTMDKTAVSRKAMGDEPISETIADDSAILNVLNSVGVLVNKTPDEFITAVANHRFWNRKV
ncbi:MAG: catalase [Ignavibacteria bacterium]|nr:catalase [Ignavibacteria bacterium]